MRRIIQNVRKIAVLRANAVGDFVFAMPALTALKRTYPRAEIVLLGRPWHVEFLAGRPGPVDRVEPIPLSKGLHELEGREENVDEQHLFFGRMQGERFDIALQLHGGGRYSNPFVKRLGAKVSVGTKTPDAVSLDFWIPYVREQREVLSLLDTVSLVGAVNHDVQPRLYLTARDVLEADQALGGMRSDEPIVVLNPGATDPRRRWPAERFANIGNAFSRLGARVVVNGGAGEEALCAAVATGMSPPADDVCGRLSLRGLLGLLARSRLLISNDTGALHLALAIGTPVVGIYLGFNLLTSGPMTNFRNRSFASWQQACRQCAQTSLEADCGHDESFVASVGSEEVFDAAQELFHGGESLPFGAWEERARSLQSF